MQGQAEPVLAASLSYRCEIVIGDDPVGSEAH